MYTQSGQKILVMSTTTATKITDMLRVMFSAHGLPEQIICDNRLHFISSEFADFMSENKVMYIYSVRYHPSTNRLAKRFVQSLKQSLKAGLHSARSLNQGLYIPFHVLYFTTF